MDLDKLTVTTTSGDTFTGKDHAKLAQLIYARFGRDLSAATAAWRRMLQNSCTEADFEALVHALDD